jgi:hypothetical protein
MDARELLGKDGWAVTACGLVLTPHRCGPEDHTCNAIDPKQVQLCEDWITSTALPCKKATGYSYGLKHVVERWANTYISNGAFIQASLNLGLVVEPEEPSWRGINCFVNVRAPKSGAK